MSESSPPREGHDPTEARLRAVLRAEAARVAPDPGALARIRSRIDALPWWRRRPALAGGAGLVATAAAVALAVAVVGLPGGEPDALDTVASPSPSPSARPSSGADASAEPTPSPSTSPGTGTATGATTPTPAPGTAAAVPSAPARTVPAPPPDLVTAWPYATRLEGYAARDDAPARRSDPVATASEFVQDVLGHPEVDVVLGTAAREAGVEVTLGRGVEGGSPVPVTRVYLVRVHAGEGAPYVVVSAAASRLQVTAPAHGGSTARPVDVRGRITGVDESVAVSLRTPTGAVVGGGAASGGGTDAPWSVQLDPPSALSGRVVVAVHTESAADGGAQELVVVPVTLPPA